MNAKNTTPLLVTINDALTLTGLGRTKFYELIKKDAVKAVLIGRRRLISYSSLENLVHGHPVDNHMAGGE